MNIKGKHLKLVMYIKDVYGVTEAQAVIQGYELSMIKSLAKKGVIAITDNKLYLPLETQNKIKIYK